MAARKLELRQRYDETAGIYDRRYEEIQRAKYQVVSEHLPAWPKRALDLGCGTGMFLGELSKISDFVVGVDASMEMLKVANVHRGKAALVLADADRLPFTDESFDLVVSVTLLQNMPNPATTVKEVARALEKKGIAILTVLKRKHSEEELGEWVEQAGMRPVAMGKIKGSEDVFCVASR